MQLAIISKLASRVLYATLAMLPIGKDYFRPLTSIQKSRGTCNRFERGDGILCYVDM